MCVYVNVVFDPFFLMSDVASPSPSLGDPEEEDHAWLDDEEEPLYVSHSQEWEDDHELDDSFEAMSLDGIPDTQTPSSPSPIPSSTIPVTFT